MSISEVRAQESFVVMSNASSYMPYVVRINRNKWLLRKTLTNLSKDMYCRHRCRLYYDIDFCFKCQVCHSSHVVYEKHKLLSGFLKLFAFLALENPMIQNDCFIFSHIFSYRPFRQERACNSRLTSFFSGIC